MRRILFDTGVPKPLRQSLAGYAVRRAQEMGWGQLKNGELLVAAQGGGFDLFVTSDKNLAYQQNLAKRTIAILVLPTNDWRLLKSRTHEIVNAVGTMQPGEYRVL